MRDVRNKCSNMRQLSRLIRHRHGNGYRVWYGGGNRCSSLRNNTITDSTLDGTSQFRIGNDIFCTSAGKNEAYSGISHDQIKSPKIVTQISEVSEYSPLWNFYKCRTAGVHRQTHSCLPDMNILWGCTFPCSLSFTKHLQTNAERQRCKFACRRACCLNSRNSTSYPASYFEYVHQFSKYPPEYVLITIRH